jgi:N-methylhydantoinase A
MRYIVGVDIGGTFTDCVVVDEYGAVTVGKSLSKPDDFSLGALDAIGDAGRKLRFSKVEELLAETRLFFHACTIGENTLITGAGARTGLITTSGFKDALLMMRGKTSEGLTEAEAAHLSAVTKPEPIIPRSLISEVCERVDYKGAVILRLTPEEAKRAVEEIISKGAESIAVCLLWSVANECHEKIVGEVISQSYPKTFYSLSSEAAPFSGEYERCATTAFNAYIGPKISSYLVNLKTILRQNGLKIDPLIMQAYGGVLGIEATCKNAVGTIESGPASGVVGTQFLGHLIDNPNILATDMGGTTFKVSVVKNGLVERDYRPVILRYNVMSTKIWVESIGAGGGSIAWIDPETQLLKVGPRGAGAKPGPVCYGMGGTEPTVSDADLALGYLNDNYFLGGRMKLDKPAALRAIDDKIATPLGLGVLEAASGIYRIANSHMSDLIRKATVERGHDPRDFVLFAYGGAGPVHASRLASDLGIRQLVIPLTASVQGATGLITSDVAYEYGRSDHLAVPASCEKVNANFAILVQRALDDLAHAGFDRDNIAVIRSVDMRYRHQVHELNVSLEQGTDSLTEAELDNLYYKFDSLYEQTYGPGSAYKEAGKELITFRVTAVGKLPKPKIKKEKLHTTRSTTAEKGKRKVYFEEDRDLVLTPIYDFDALEPGHQIAGPAIIETPVTTIVVNPTNDAELDQFRNVRIWLNGRK